MQLSNQKNDPPIALVERERRRRETRYALKNDQSLPRKFKKFSFFDENWAEKQFWQKLSQHAYQLNGVPKISAATLAFGSLL